MRRLTSELLKHIDTVEDKVSATKEAIVENPALLDVLHINFDPAWEFNLAPSYPEKFKLDETTPYGLSITELIKDRKKLQIFRKHGPYATLDQARREIIFLNFIECLHYTEAEVLVFAKDKALNELFPWITESFYNVLIGKAQVEVVETVAETVAEEAVKEEPQVEDEQPKRRGRPRKSA